MMNEESVKIWVLRHLAARIIYDLFGLFGHISINSLFFRVVIISLLILSLSTGIFAQAVRLISSNYKWTVIVDVVPSMTCLLACLVYLPIGYANRNTYKELVMFLEMNDGEKRTEEEETIKKRYDKYILIISTFITISVLLGSVGLLLPGLLPPVLDFIIPLNESRPRTVPFQAEYFVDQEEYFYEILLLQYINILAVLAIGGSTEVIFLMFILYTCGMFEVLGYRLENIAKGEDVDKQEYIHRDEALISRIGEIVESHKAILMSVQLIRAINVSAEPLFLFLLAVTLLIVSISLVQVINPQLVTVKSVLMALVALGQFFVVSFAGQLIIDASEKLPLNTYNSDWCICSAKVQKNFILLLMKTGKACSISALNTYSMSFQNLSAVLRTGVSYAMVLKQLDE